MVQVIDETETDFRALIERDIGPLPAGADLGRTLLDWLHFRARSIPPRPRAVIVSAEVEAKLKSYPAIHKIKNALLRGKDVAPWLSDSVRAKAKVSDPKADMMFNDWQIIHFHLGNLFVGADKIHRTRPVLFAFIADDRAVLLDVLLHGHGVKAPWAMSDLLRILLRVSPQDMRELKGIVAGANNWTDEEIIQLRQFGVTAPIVLDGRSFVAPGLGVSTSGHSTRTGLLYQAMGRSMAKARTDLENNLIAPQLLKRIALSIGSPVRLGVRIENGRLMLYDKSRNLDLQLLMNAI